MKMEVEVTIKEVFLSTIKVVVEEENEDKCAEKAEELVRDQYNNKEIKVSHDDDNLFFNSFIGIPKEQIINYSFDDLINTEKKGLKYETTSVNLKK